MIAHLYATARRNLPIGDKLSQLSWGFIALICLISGIGIAMLYSVAGGAFSPWASRQLIHFVAGFVIMIVIALTDIRVWMKLAYPAYIASLLLLLAVELVGHEGLGAQRWLSIGPVDIQPSEFMKISLILAVSRFLHNEKVEDVSKPQRLIIPLAMIALPAALVAIQPNLGTTIILVLDGCVLLFLAGLSWKWIVPTFAAIIAAVPVAWRFVLHDYQKARVMTFLDPESDALGAGWNITQAKIAIGSGGIFGKGFLQGTQSRLNFLPEKQTDFIFTNYAEEFGFVGCLILFFLFLCVIGYGVRVAMSARSQFARLLAMGVTLNFFFYIMINAAMVMGLIPVVGIPMPLISYGGTALISVLAGFGLLISVHVHRQVEIPRHAATMV